jgi:hypothetical protein
MAATAEQCMAALARANEIRLANSQLKRQIRAGVVAAADVLRDPPAEALSMPIGALLMAVPRVGDVRMSVLLRRHRVSPTRRIDRLTERERLSLASALSGTIPCR